ncbi:hypothetical protein Gp_19 [Bacillus phage vB_Bacillus_1020A]|uniref:hypothetical protein n=1 Tax=Robertmurraya sp. DFI.2.37 TaxID=3031819 RepID=UPI0012488AA0|nr:hypothetical protein [Robertmurraya sp. DFI.2.37]MDF1510813.1 hypothetical protein [Robertmurraya sp. DFI.2.37]QIW89293.1 hypothetical protein Gp_19 [Bacillus phage vB_Bacillus_1020A]
MKYHTQFACLDEECRTIVVGHGCRLDGIRCPRCDGLVVPRDFKPKQKIDAPLLKITLEDINSVPLVTYKGEEIKGKINVSFDWETDTQEINPTYIFLKFADPESEQGDVKSIIHNEPREKVTLYADGEPIDVILCDK